MGQQSIILSYQNLKVGELSVDSDTNQLSFSYDPQWEKDGFPISPHLSFSHPETLEQNINIFIENILPEEENRELLARNIGISRTSVFGLIRKIGMETTGAILFSDHFPPQFPQTSFRPISDQELIQRLDQDRTDALVYWDGKPRLSIAGIQRKLPITIMNEQMGLAEGAICSTHILKFQAKKMEQKSIVLNEYLCMNLAHACQLPVAQTSYHKVGAYPYLLVKRFDRNWDQDESVIRTHIIDGCQAMNLPVNYKYERPFGSEGEVKNFREGATYNKLFDCLNLCKSPVKAKLIALRWIIFNLIIGNTDSHAKNISFFLNDTGMELAPFYDLVNVEIYQDYFNTELALSFGDEFKLRNIGAYEIAQFCEQLKLKRHTLRNETQKMAKSVLKQIDQVRVPTDILTDDEMNFLKELVVSIKDRAQFFLDESIKISKIELV